MIVEVEYSELKEGAMTIATRSIMIEVVFVSKTEVRGVDDCCLVEVVVVGVVHLSRAELLRKSTGSTIAAAMTVPQK